MRGGAATAGQTEGASDPWHIPVVTPDTIPQFWSRATRLHPTDSWPLHQQPLNQPLRFAATVYLLRLTGNGKSRDRRHRDARGTNWCWYLGALTLETALIALGIDFGVDSDYGVAG